MLKLKSFFSKYGLLICGIIAFTLPLIIYILTLEPKLVGGDTSWFAIYVPRMEVLVPTGYPSFSIFGKLATLIPVKDIAYRLNLMSAIFGGGAVLFLFLAINKITKNVIISLASALSFGFAISFWQIANRFEMDSINCFYLALLLYATFLYDERPDRPRLYFVAVSMGLFLTDHPIALFIIPSILIYVILVKPAMFKNAKAVLLGIMFFVLPLFSYAFIPIRSAAGFGPVRTLKGFFYYVTGRYTNGQVHGGSFGDKDWPNFVTVAGEFFKIIYKNFGPILIVVAIAGLIYLFKKNYKLAGCFVLLVISNLLIMSQFIGWAAENHVLDTMIIVTVLAAFGLMLVFDMLGLLINKISKLKNNKSSQAAAAKYIILTIFFAAILVFPVMFATGNYALADQSQPEEIYLFWDNLFKTADTGSGMYVSSISSNIGQYISIYEQQDKNISYITNKDSNYTAENIIKDLEASKQVYLVGVQDFLLPYFNLERIDGYRWQRFGENIIVYRVTGQKLQLEIVPSANGQAADPKDPFTIKFGQIFTLEYKIINNYEQNIKVTSLELSIPKNIKFIETDKSGLTENPEFDYITDTPGIAQGKYMWVKEYIVKSGGSMTLRVNLQAKTTGDSVVKFSVTSQDFYMDSPEVKLNILED